MDFRRIKLIYYRNLKFTEKCCFFSFLIEDIFLSLDEKENVNFFFTEIMRRNVGKIVLSTEF